MEILIFVLVTLVIFTTIFLFVLNRYHTQHQHAVPKLYINNKEIEISNNTLTIAGQPLEPTAVPRIEEFTEALFASLPFTEMWPNPLVQQAVSVTLQNPLLAKYRPSDDYPHSDTRPFDKNLGYSSCYLETYNESGIMHLIGEVDPVLETCSEREDKEEIKRIAKKWQRQGLHCLAVTTADIETSQRNILKRGVRNQMMLLGLIAIKA